MEERKRKTGINAGSSSIMVIFVLLCLTIFSALSLVSANADYKLAQKTAEASSAYYTADAQAEEALAVVVSWCRKALEKSNSARTYATELMAQQGAASSASTATEEEAMVTISYTIPLSEQRKLQVILESDYNLAKEGKFYTLKAWNTVPTQEWTQGEEGITVWDGVSPFGE